jgi:SsrA-binding protein
MSPPNKPKTGGSRTIALNRRAYHDYLVLDSIEAGIMLTGTEIKSIRAGKVSITEAFARIENHEMFLYGAQISPYEQGNINNHKQDRTRKLLLHQKEIIRLQSKMKEQGLTLIPLKLYFKNAWVKVELGLCKGKKLHDKRDAIKTRDAKRDMQRVIKAFN